MSDVPEKKPDDADEPGDGTWSEDQKKREYYYDDAHGYEKYDPNGEEEAMGDAKLPDCPTD